MAAVVAAERLGNDVEVADVRPAVDRLPASSTPTKKATKVARVSAFEVPFRALAVSPTRQTFSLARCSVPPTMKCGPGPIAEPIETKASTSSATGSASVCGESVRTISPGRPCSARSSSCGHPGGLGVRRTVIERAICGVAMGSRQQCAAARAPSLGHDSSRTPTSARHERMRPDTTPNAMAQAVDTWDTRIGRWRRLIWVTRPFAKRV